MDFTIRELLLVSFLEPENEVQFATIKLTLNYEI